MVEVRDRRRRAGSRCDEVVRTRQDFHKRDSLQARLEPLSPGEDFLDSSEVILVLRRMWLMIGTYDLHCCLALLFVICFF